MSDLILLQFTESQIKEIVTMSSRRMKVSKCPSDALTMTNRAIVNPRDFDKQVHFKDSILQYVIDLNWFLTKKDKER